MLAAVATIAATVLRSAAASPAAAPTFSTEIAPILYQHCISCHRDGGMSTAAPLDSYAGAQQMAAAIKREVRARTMPPWPADSAHSAPFSNDARLTQNEIDLLSAWVDGGAPLGLASAVPPPPHFTPGWQSPDGRPPDSVVSLPLFSVKARGEIPYIQLRVKVPMASDRWIAAMQVLPGNGTLVHHMGIAEVELTGGVKAQDLEQLESVAKSMGLPGEAFIKTKPAVVDAEDPSSYDMLATYTPGTTLESYGEGNAKLLRGGKDLYINFNIHYTTTGKPETDLSRLGFWFQKQPPKHQLFRIPSPGKTIIANGTLLLTDDPGSKAEGTDVAIPPIPPFAGNYELIGVTAYPRPVTFFSFQPHSHMRGKDFRYAIVYPDGREETVLSVPNYDFHWQLTYTLATPLRLPAGSKLVVTAHYDNSLGNKHLNESAAKDPARNCGPEKQAHFRSQNQSWDEMFSPIIQYSEDDADPAASSAAASGPGDARVQTAPATTALAIVESVGCLVRGTANDWLLARATAAVATKTQSMTRAEIAAASGKPAGDRRYQLIGTGVFRPDRNVAHRVVIKGVRIDDAHGSRLNVTSLASTGDACE